jgi:hypothetical protein
VALAASLLRRGRDIAIAVPALLSWQFLEGRRAWQDAAANDLAAITEPAITGANR